MHFCGSCWRSSRDFRVAKQASSLEAIGPSALPELLEAYRVGNSWVSGGAATVLYWFDTQAAVKAGVK